jgi:hypothetical protein
MTWFFSHLVTTLSHVPSRSHHSQCVGGARGIMQREPGAGVRGPASLTQPPRLGPGRPSPRMFLTRLPTPLAHVVLEEGPVEHQALLHVPAGGRHDPLFRPGQRAKLGPHLLLKGRTRGLRHLGALPRRLELQWENSQLRLLSSLSGSGARPPPMPLLRALR